MKLLPGHLRTPGFWYKATPGWQANLLRPLGWLYGAITARRMGRRGEDAGVQVICIGNVTAGGAGKTPVTMALANLLAGAGETPIILSRGHGGTLSGPLLVDTARHTAAAVGDEPALMAQQHQVIVARDRVAGAALAVAHGASLVLLDDGLQNPALAKTFSIAVFDGMVGIGNGLCVPAGPLRAPLEAQWPWIDAVVIIGAGAAGDAITAVAQALAKPVFLARLVPDDTIAEALKGQRVLALAGLGRPGKFAATLRELGADVAETAFFADHHPYTRAELDHVAARAKAVGAAVVTTQKDAMRLEGQWDPARHGPLAILPVTVTFADAPGLVSAILQRGKAL